jgi:hypothetical protein
MDLANHRLEGYHGIWFTLGQFSGYGDKYSGGLGTYTANHRPIAVYSEKANRTFFVYGGTKRGLRHLLVMASYFDHSTGEVPRPTVVHDKKGVDDPHDNGSICMDGKGYVWVFVSGRGRRRSGFKYRSERPYDTSSFLLFSEEEMTYAQPWWLEEKGFLHLFTKYTAGRELYWETSPDGKTWSEDQKLAGMGGHYQVSGQSGGKIMTAFNTHPNGDVDKRTNLYFVQTRDTGSSWTTAADRQVQPPLTETRSHALVRDYQSEGLLVYPHDLTVDRNGRPLILYLTSRDHRPGPDGDPRVWTLAHWQGDKWSFQEVTRSTHNYDTGSVYVEGDGRWRVIGPTEPGPQKWGTGGEVAAWSSTDEGRTWRKEKEVTRGSRYNHSYVRRPVGAQPAFYAFWADGNPDSFSDSRLYFCNAAGEAFVLPEAIAGERARPVKVYTDGGFGQP